MPGNEDRIDSYVNLNATGKETATFRKQLNEIYDQIVKINATKVTLQGGDGSFKEKAAAAALLRKEQADLNKIVIESARLQKLEAAALKESANAEAAKERAQRESIKTQSANLDLLDKEEKLLTKKAAAQAKVAATAAKNVAPEFVVNPSRDDSDPNKTGTVVSAADLQKAAVTNTAFAQTTEQVTKAEKELGQEVKKTSEQIRQEAIQKERLRQENQKEAAALKLYVKETSAEKGTLIQRAAALERLNLLYANTSPQDKATAAGQRLKKITADLKDQVNNLKKEVGDTSSNIGNYEQDIDKAASKTGGFVKGVSKAFGALRNLAYILPGVGLAGLIGFAVDPIVNFIKKIYESANALKILQAEIRESLNAANASSAGDLAKQGSQLEAYVKIAKSDVYTKKEQAEAINAINKLIPDTIGVITKQNIATEEGTRILALYTEQLLKRAKVEVYSSEIGKLETKRFEARTKLLSDLSKVERDITSTEARIRVTTNNIGQNSAGLAEGGGGTAEADARARLATLQNQRRVLSEEYLKTGRFIVQEQAKLSKVVLDNSVGLVPDDKNAKASGDKLRAIQKKFFEDALKDEMAFNLELSKNEDFALKARLELRKRAFEIENQLSDENRKTELENEKAKLDSVLSQKSGKNAIINAQNEYRQKVLEINEKYDYADQKAASNNETDILIIKASANAKKLDLDKKYNEEAAADFKKQAEERLQRMIDDANRTNELAKSSTLEARDIRLRALAEAESIDLNSAKTPLRRQLIEEKYNRLRVKKELETTRDLLKIDRDYADAQIKIAQAQADASMDPNEKKSLSNKIVAAKAGLAEVNKQLAELDNKVITTTIDLNTKEFQAQFVEIEDALTKISKTMTEVFGAIGDIISIGVEKAKNAIAEDQRLADERNQKEIDYVNQLALTEEQKAARLMIIEARAEAQKKQFDERNRIAEERRLKFEKAANIAKIGVETALAVVHQLGSGDPYTAIARAVAVGLLGAVQLATAIATPIPKYGDGTEDGLHPGGLAWLGDKYKRERGILPNGQQFDSASTPTLYNLPKGTRILPDADQVDEAMFNMSMRKMAKVPVVNENTMLEEMIRATNKGHRGTIAAIKGKTTTIINNTYSGATMSFKKAQGYHEFVQRQTQTKVK